MAKYKRKKILCPHCVKPFYQVIPPPSKNCPFHFQFICPHCGYTFSRTYKHLLPPTDSE